MILEAARHAPSGANSQPWDRFHMNRYMTPVAEWIKEQRHKVMFRDESRID